MLIALVRELTDFDTRLGIEDLGCLVATCGKVPTVLRELYAAHDTVKALRAREKREYALLTSYGGTNAQARYPDSS